MSECNATIEIGGAPFRCDKPRLPERIHRRHYSDTQGIDKISVAWDDGSPGATPHEDPTPTYHDSWERASALWQQNYLDARSEADSYRRALQKIAAGTCTAPGRSCEGNSIYECLMQQAAEALNGGDA